MQISKNQQNIKRNFTKQKCYGQHKIYYLVNNWKIIKNCNFPKFSRNNISRVGKLMRDNATIIYLASLTLFIVDEALCVSCPCSPVNFGIFVAHWRNEKRKIVATMATMVVVFRGSMTVTRQGRLQRKMKHYDKGVRSVERRSTKRIKNVKRCVSSLRDVRSKRECIEYS